MKVTSVEIEYKLSPSYEKVIIPEGTAAIPADNLPSPGDRGFWVEPWANMGEGAESYMRNYGFYVDDHEVRDVTQEEWEAIQGALFFGDADASEGDCGRCGDDATLCEHGFCSDCCGCYGEPTFGEDR